MFFRKPHDSSGSPSSRLKAELGLAYTIAWYYKYTLGLSSAEVTLKRPLRWTTAPSDVSSAALTETTKE